jgi:tRNA threonylcarbamoyladenosine biosynthesis protein TsaB
VKVLALDGALGGFSVALAIDGEIAGSRGIEGNQTLEGGLGVLAELLASSGLAPQTLDRLAVGVGPGGFTGLRITIAYAKALALAWHVPLAAVSSFDLLEYGRDLDCALTVVVGRPGVISARYREGGTQRRASGRTATVLEAVVPSHSGRTLPVIGAPEDVLNALAEAGITVEPLTPLVAPPAAAAALAAATVRPAASPHAVRADYGETPAAKVPDFPKNVRPR